MVVSSHNSRMPPFSLQVFNHAGYNDAGQAAWLMFWLWHCCPSSQHLALVSECLGGELCWCGWQVFQKREKGKLCPATAPSVNSLCRHIPKQNWKTLTKSLWHISVLSPHFQPHCCIILTRGANATEGTNLEAIFQRPGLQHQQVSPTYVQGATKASRNGNMTKECMHQNNGFEAQPPHSKIDSITHTHTHTHTWIDIPTLW